MGEQFPMRLRSYLGRLSGSLLVLLLGVVPSTNGLATEAAPALAYRDLPALDPAGRDQAARDPTVSAEPAIDGALQAVRRALLESLARSEMRVHSLAWIDRHGALHETAQFHADTTVRGVRVQAYLDENQRTAWRAEIQSVAGRLKDTSDCAPERTDWRIPVGGELSIADPMRPQDAAVPGLLAQEFHVWLGSAVARGPRWAVLPMPPAFLSGEPARTVVSQADYLSVLTGAQQDRPSWRLRLELIRASSDPETWRLGLRLIHAPSATTVWQQWATPAHGGSAQPFVGAGEVAALRMLLHSWAQDSASVAPCELPRLPLVPAGERFWRAPAGAEAGLAEGQRALILDADRMPGRSIEDAAVHGLAIAEVVGVQAGRARLKQIAGPDLPVSGRWVALPFQ